MMVGNSTNKNDIERTSKWMHSGILSFIVGFLSPGIPNRHGGRRSLFNNYNEVYAVVKSVHLQCTSSVECSVRWISCQLTFDILGYQKWTKFLKTCPFWAAFVNELCTTLSRREMTLGYRRYQRQTERSNLAKQEAPPLPLRKYTWRTANKDSPVISGLCRSTKQCFLERYIRVERMGGRKRSESDQKNSKTSREITYPSGN